MINYFKRTILIVSLISLFLIFGIPILIDLAFKTPAPISILEVNWGAKEALSFYGSILGAALTIFGVVITILYSRRSYQEDMHNRVLPYCSLYSLRYRSYFNILSLLTEKEEKSSEEDYYEEYRLKEINICINNGKIQYKSQLSKEQIDIIQHNGLKKTKTPDGFKVNRIEFINHPFEIENVGNGAAINFRLGLNPSDCKNLNYTTPIHLRKGDKVYVRIFSENPNEQVFKKYKLGLYYEDILKRKYMQHFDYEIKKEGKDFLTSLDFDSCQQIIN